MVMQQLGWATGHSICPLLMALIITTRFAKSIHNMLLATKWVNCQEVRMNAASPCFLHLESTGPDPHIVSPLHLHSILIFKWLKWGRYCLVARYMSNLQCSGPQQLASMQGPSSF
jgi:hypothetical protein